MSLRSHAAVLLALPLACAPGGNGYSGIPTQPEPLAQASPVGSAGIAPSPPALAPSAPLSSAEPVLPGKPPSRSPAELFEKLGEAEQKALPNAYVSAEPSMLQVAPLLVERHAPGGAYIGVGAEQNFTYIALVEPEVAFIVDPRRSNALLHLLYKAMFDEARTRSEFLSFLIGRPYDARDEPPPDATARDVIAHVEVLGTFAELRRATSERLIERIATKYGFRLTAADRAVLDGISRAFYERQLDIHLEAKGTATPGPKLREQLMSRAPNGPELGFLAQERAFRYVQRMHRENRIIPLVGDLAGARALPGIGAYLAAEQIRLGTFYVSDAEERLFQQKLWPKWVTNVGTLPADEQSVFVRTWNNDAGGHPRQFAFTRTTTLLQRVADFRAREQKGTGWPSYKALAFDASQVTGVTRPR
jgi:hypothetical protein